MATRRKVVNPEPIRRKNIFNELRDELREAFVLRLTVGDNAIFDAVEGWAIWDRTDLTMVMREFDWAVKDVVENQKNREASV